MVLSTKTARGIVLGLLVLLGGGIASAQDYEKVYKGLMKFVKKGEITQQQAERMMGVLKKAPAKDKRDVKLDGAWKRLQAMVKQGKLTEEQAKARMMALKKSPEKGKQRADRVPAPLVKLRKELGAAVKAGKLSKAEAAKKFEAAKKGLERKTRAQVGQPEGKPGRITRERYARIEADLKKAVNEGRISPEAARKRLQGLRQGIAEPQRRVRGDHEHSHHKHDHKKHDREAMARRLKAAVKAGKLTEAEAKAKWKAMTKDKD